MDAPSAPRAFPLPSISEDTLHYVLHPAPPASSQAEPGSVSTSTAERDEADLTAQATLISSFVASLLPTPWLWNKDPWELKAVNDDERKHGDAGKGRRKEEGRLEGRMRVGDAVDDEWLVVWLLREVSRRWRELVISIRDSDGEFLLIEAAHELPAWVSPDNAENRLWLYDGHLHLLPLSVRSDNKPRQIADDEYDAAGRAATDAWVSEDDAIAAVRTGKYRAPEVERAVWERISSYPAALATHQHRAKAYLPEPIARALHTRPELIQRAVEGFYVRDPAQLRAASRMTRFPPSPAVLAPVQMTRAAYAQLQGQVFHPPRVFGPEWHVRDDQGEAERRWRDLGVKIATGVEIMYREGGRKGRVADTDVEERVRDEPEYRQYLADLKRAGWFGDEVEGSKRWKEREAEAAKGWIEARSSDTTQQRPSFAYLVDTAIESTKETPAEALAVSPDSAEDSDKWLEVDPDELDAMMKRAAGGGAGAPATGSDGEAELGEEHGRALKDLAGQLEAFVGGQGDLEGARFADELSDEDMDSDSEGDEAPTAAEREERLRNLVPALPASEWGASTSKAKPEAADTAGDDAAAEDDVDMPAEMPAPSQSSPGTVAGSAYGDSLLPTNMRPPRFEAVHYDGVESDTSSDEEDDLPPRGTLGRHISEMKWGQGDDGTREARIEEISDEGEDEDERAEKERARALRFDDDIDEQMRRRVWGGDEEGEEQGMDVDEGGNEGEGDDGEMDGDQTAQFLKFARDALQIDDAMWSDILASRRERGAFVPEGQGSAKAGASGGKSKAKDAAPPKSEPVPQPQLNTFESMMAAMDGELARHAASGPAEPAKGPQFVKPASAASASAKKKKNKKKQKPTVSFAPDDGDDGGEPAAQPATSAAKPKFATAASLPDPAELDDMSDDALAAMDAELRAALRASGADPDADDELDIPEAEGLEGDARREYAMMRDLMESYRSQGGEAGVVGNLFGRLGEQRK